MIVLTAESELLTSRYSKNASRFLQGVSVQVDSLEYRESGLYTNAI
jgi:hypothetical protein